MTTQSTESRTTIDFDEHGPKTFVTEMLEAELIADPAPGAGRPRRRRKAAIPKA